jgi:hypothetical protein
VKSISVTIKIEEDDEEVLDDLRKELDEAISTIVQVGGHDRADVTIGPWEDEEVIDLSHDPPES